MTVFILASRDELWKLGALCLEENKHEEKETLSHITSVWRKFFLKNTNLRTKFKFGKGYGVSF